MRHLRTTLDVGDLKTLEALLLRTQELKRHRAARRLAPTLSGRVIGMLFEKPSTRTRVSFEAGVKLLGGATIVLQGRDLWLGGGSHVNDDGGEVLRDTARVLGTVPTPPSKNWPATLPSLSSMACRTAIIPARC